MQVAPIKNFNSFQPMKTSKNNENNTTLKNEVDEYSASKISKKKIAKVGFALGIFAVGSMLVFKLLGASKSKEVSINNIDLKPQNYLDKLASALSIDMGQKVSSQNLTSVMTKEEFLSEIPKLTEQNFIKSPENIKNGTFFADLHSHSNYSDGNISIKDFLSQAATYGDNLNKINGKKFIIALSDHDGVEGVKEALRLIAKEPEKYKNIKFIPAAELNFQTKCEEGSYLYNKHHNKTESSEVLAYFINPFSENSKIHFENLYKKRNQQISDAIKLANEKLNNGTFSIEEYHKCFIVQPWQQNPHWRLYNYLQIKNRINKIAKIKKENPNELFQQILPNLKHYGKYDFNPYGLNKYLTDNNMTCLTPDVDNKLTELLKTEGIFPDIKNDTVYSKYDKNFSDVLQYVQEEKDSLIGFAHPAFTIRTFNPQNAIKSLNNLVTESKGKLVFAEKFHAYKFDGRKDAITYDELNKSNAILDTAKLINVGGYDNHTKTLI